jgi:hypothetical protein
MLSDVWAMKNAVGRRIPAMTLNRARTVRRLLLAFLLAAPAGGCADSAGERCAVSGTVSFRGQPLDQGMILFIPAAGDLATQSGTAICKGHYAIPQPQGLVPGRYRISISSGDGTTPADPSGGPPGPSGNFSSKERIPRDFNVASTHEVEVTKDGPNRFDFTIP